MCPMSGFSDMGYHKRELRPPKAIGQVGRWPVPHPFAASSRMGGRPQSSTTQPPLHRRNVRLCPIHSQLHREWVGYLRPQPANRQLTTKAMCPMSGSSDMGYHKRELRPPKATGPIAGGPCPIHSQLHREWVGDHNPQPPSRPFIAAMCAGVDPQHPPNIFTCLAIGAISAAKASGPQW